MCGYERESFDLDKHDSLRLLAVYYNLRYLGFHPKVARTHKGFHVTFNSSASRKRLLELRRIMGDDPNRIWLSEQRLHRKCHVTFDLCFAFKHQRDGTETREEDTREPLEPQYFPWGGTWKRSGHVTKRRMPIPVSASIPIDELIRS